MAPNNALKMLTPVKFFYTSSNSLIVVPLYILLLLLVPEFVSI